MISESLYYKNYVVSMPQLINWFYPYFMIPYFIKNDNNNNLDYLELEELHLT